MSLTVILYQKQLETEKILATSANRAEELEIEKLCKKTIKQKLKGIGEQEKRKQRLDTGCVFLQRVCIIITDFSRNVQM